MKKLGFLTILFASLFVFMLAGTQETSAQGKGKHGKWKDGSTTIVRTDRSWSGTRRNRRGPYMGYRNYGQYRRTQVGNRRYRTVRRSVWRDGERVTRLVRMYY